MTDATGKVFVPRGWEWDRTIEHDDREAIIDRVLMLPAWVDNQLGAQNLDVKKLEDRESLWRLRVGAFRAVFQIFGKSVVLHRVFRRKGDTDYDDVKLIVLVRAGEGLRTLVEDTEEPPPVPQSTKPVIRPVRRPVAQNPLTSFTDAELLGAGLSQDAVDRLRLVPAELLPDRTLKALGVEPSLIRFIAEMWERPGAFSGKDLSQELASMTESEAVERLMSDYSTLSLASIDDAGSFLALLDSDIEDWMVYLHPLQMGAARRPMIGPSRVRGAAGTGKTVVALHRARFLADETDGEILLTTFVNNLPKVWENLLASFPEPARGKIRCRTVNQLARELYYSGGGERDIADPAQRDALIHDVWAPRHTLLGGQCSPIGT